MNDELMEQAKAAIREVFEDTSVDLLTAKENLKTLGDLCDELLQAIAEDLRNAEED